MSQASVTISAAGGPSLHGEPSLGTGFQVLREPTWIDSGGGERACSQCRTTLYASIELQYSDVVAASRDFDAIVRKKATVKFGAMSFTGYITSAQWVDPPSESARLATVHLVMEEDARA